MSRLVTLALGVACLNVIGCAERSEEAALYRAVAAQPRDIVVAVESAGVIEPITLVEVKSKASGEILELAVESGQTVEAGALLVKIDQRVPRNALAQAEAGLEVARARLDNADAQLRRIQKLFTASSVSEADREQAALDVANAKAEVVRSEVAVENARIAMEDTVVSAPITGTVIERLVERGQVISSPGQDVGGGTLLMRMADLTRVRVRAMVDETDIGKVIPGIAARVAVAAYPNRSFEGRVLKIEPQAAAVQNVTMFPVLVELENAHGLLKPGMNADVTVDVVRRAGVLAIPVAALQSRADAEDTAELVGIAAEEIGRVLAAASSGEGEESSHVRDDTFGGSDGIPGSADVTSGHGDAMAGSGVEGTSVRERMQGIRAKRGRGEALTEEERAFVASMRERFRARGTSPPLGGPASETGSTPRRPFTAELSGQYLVFVQGEGGIEPRAIDAGITDLDYVEIRSGVTAGERVLLLPSASLLRAQEGFRERLVGRMRAPIGGPPSPPR